MEPRPLPEANAAAMANLPAYAETRDSGVDWLGKVPAHWEVRRIASLARILNGATPSSTHAPYWGGDIPWITPTDLGALAAEAAGAGRRISRTARSLTKAGYEACGASLAPPDSLALSTRAPIGHLAILNHSCCTNQGCRLLVPNDHIRSEFLYYALFTLREEVRAFGQGSTFSELSREKLAAFRISLPPLAEQTAIVRFLDYVDRRIRRYIRAKEKLIALLEEQKQAVIHQAVTGQIDVRTGQPYPAYKGSGVEWLGKVPEHWTIRKIRQCTSISGGVTPSMEDGRFWNGDVPWVTPKDMKTMVIDDSRLRVTEVAFAETPLRLIRAPAVLMVVRGMILARKVPIALTAAPVTINQDMKALTPHSALSAAYLATFLDGAHDGLFPLIDEAGHGTRRLPTERWRDLPLTIPPQTEQTAICRHVHRVTTGTTASLDRARSQIALLREFRARLTADVVTGKLDVREAAGSLPEVDPLEADGPRGQTAFR